MEEIEGLGYAQRGKLMSFWMGWEFGMRKEWRKKWEVTPHGIIWLIWKKCKQKML